MIYLFAIPALLLVFFSFRSFTGGTRYLRFFRSELEKPPSRFTPFATVIVPCRGIDQGLYENLAAHLHHDYPRYEVIFVVDDDNDPAAEVIRAVGKDNAADLGEQERCRSARLAVAPKAAGMSQKAENLREGVRCASPHAEVFAFADSDARPSAGWLRSLIAPLADDHIGAATGYRWFIAASPSAATELRSAWNASIASALGPDEASNFCWGGATALRRETFEQLRIADAWIGTLSDDFVVTRVLRAAGAGVAFVPRSLTASVENCTFRELVEFTTRQMKITRVYAAKLWLMSFFGSALFSAVMSAAILIVVLAKDRILWWTAAATLVAVAALSIGKAILRMQAVQLALPQYAGQLRRQMLPQCVLWAITPPLFLGNCVAAWASRRITWRGTTYELVSPTETKVIGHAPDGTPAIGE